MKKNIKSAVAFAIAVLSSCALFACGEQNVNVSFVQDGQETIVKTVGLGGTLTDVPQPVQVDGYTVVWDRTDFSALPYSITVKAVLKPNTYVIQYEIEENAWVDERTQTVRYGETFALATPTLDGRVFVGWQLAGTDTFVENGQYTWADNITLTAVWDVDNQNEYTYFY